MGFFCCISGKLSPITAYDKNGIRLLLHLAANRVAGRPDVLVMVASIFSTAPLLAKDVVLQAAVPKVKRRHSPNAFTLRVVSLGFNDVIWPLIPQNEVIASRGTNLTVALFLSLYFFFCQMMKVRLQQPSGTELAPFNPILPPAPITQIVLVANPLKVSRALVERFL